jgi:hypothetical protein
MLSWTLRIAGWIVGIYALLKLAKATGAVAFTQVFQAWMDSLRDIVDLGFLLTPLKVAVILPALDLIRSFDIPIPPLQDHWQQVFVLTWLLSAATARNLSFGASIPVALLAAFVGTLPFCIAAGTMPLGSVAVLYWPAAGSTASLAILLLLKGNWLAGLLFAAIAAAIAYFFGTTGEGTRQLFGLVGLAVSIGVAGLMLLVLGLLVAAGTLSQRLQHPITAIGLDITAAMLGAFGLATVFADPPLF